MIRSTRVQKAERLRAARRLLADKIGMAEAAVALSRTFGLSRRQAYRYIELARAGAPPLAAENSVTITLKMPESLARGLRAHATARGVTASEVVRQAVAAFLAAKRRHLGRDRYVVPSIWSSHSIGCSLPSSNRLTTFWFLIGSAWWAAQR